MQNRMKRCADKIKEKRIAVANLTLTGRLAKNSGDQTYRRVYCLRNNHEPTTVADLAVPVSSAPFN